MAAIGKSNRRKKKWILVMAVAVILVAAVLIMKNRRSTSAGTEQQKVQTEEVSRRDLSKSVGATGTIVSKKSRDLSVNLTEAEVKKVYVSVGDTVKKGDKLIKFDTSEAEENLADAKTALDKANQKNRLAEADADRSVSDAYSTQSYQIETAKDAKDKAYSDYQDAKKAHEKAKKKLAEYKKAEEKAKKAYTENPSDVTTKTAYDTASANVEQQKQSVETAKQQMKTAKATWQSQVKAYEQTVKSQSSSVAAAKSSQSSTKLNEDTSAQEQQVRQYQKQVDNGILCAPFAGIITAVNYETGENYAGGTVITIQDCSSYEIEAEIGEYDISSVKKGQTVIIKTDATGEEEMTGKVSEISPVSVSSGSIGDTAGLSAGTGGVQAAGSSDISYRIRITIDNPSELLRLDMSANLSIIQEQHENALTVPYNAVQTKDDGTYYVTQQKDDGSTKDISVEIVMESNYYTEISSEELQEGMKVVLNEEEESDNPFENIPRGGGF